MALSPYSPLLCQLALGVHDFDERDWWETARVLLGAFLLPGCHREMQRVYGGQVWLRYDEQFRQRKAICQSLCLDHKDISL